MEKEKSKESQKIKWDANKNIFDFILAFLPPVAFYIIFKSKDIPDSVKISLALMILSTTIYFGFKFSQ